MKKLRFDFKRKEKRIKKAKLSLLLSLSFDFVI